MSCINKKTDNMRMCLTCQAGDTLLLEANTSVKVG